MTEIVVGQFGILPRFADVHRDPTSVRKKFGPAMIPLYNTLIFIGGNTCANGETGGNAYATRQRDEIGVEIGAIAGARVAGVKSVATPPARAGFIVTHPRNDVIIKRFRA